MKRIVFLADHDLVKTLDHYRSTKRPIPSIGETIRHLISVGIAADEKHEARNG